MNIIIDGLYYALAVVVTVCFIVYLFGYFVIEQASR